MNWAQIVRDLRAEFRNYVETALLDLFSYTKTSKPSKNGRDDKIEGRTSEGSEDKADSDVQRMQHYGFRSIPPVGTWAVSAKVGGQKFTLGEDSTKYAPTDLEEGELALFNSQSGVQVKLTKDGDVLIGAKSGRDIKFNGGGAKVARVGDKTTAHDHVVSFTLAADLGTGTVTGTITVSSEEPTIAEGADHVLA